MARGTTHCRGDHHDPNSGAFTEFSCGQCKMHCAWRANWHTIEQARHAIGTYLKQYDHRRHSAYRATREGAETKQPSTSPLSVRDVASNDEAPEATRPSDEN